MAKIVYYLGFLCLIFIGKCSADTPANCTFDDIQGTWVFSESNPSGERTEHCNGSEVVVNKVRVQLLFPDTAVDQNGNKGRYYVK